MNMHLSEILMVLVVALLVIKPERLPGIAFKLGKMLVWTRRTFHKIKHELQIK